MGSITCYGGVGKIGGNRILLQIKDASIFLDFGLNFGEEGRFFEEYLQPRSTSKLHDLLKLDLLPELHGIYREDVIRPRGIEDIGDCSAKPLWDCDLQSYEDAKKEDEWYPDALFVSHAHLDHTGYIPYLGDMPLLCSQTTNDLMEAMAEVGNLAGFDSDLTKMSRRYVDYYGGRAYFPGTPKIESMDEEERKKDLLGNREVSEVGDNGVSIEAFEVGHSVPGALSALIESDDKQVVYTGDLRFHGRSETKIRSQLRDLRPDVMLCEGTRIDREEPDDEEQVEKDLADTFSDVDGLAMVGFAWKDLERYETVKRAAEEVGRTPVFDPRLAYLKARLDKSIYKEGAKAFVERTENMLYSPGDYTRVKHKVGEIPVSEWSSRADVKDTKHLNNGVTAVDIREDPGDYVLQLDYYRFKNLIDLDPPEGSIYVRAQAEPFNPEMELSEGRLINWLQHFGINEDNGNEPIQIHASGHACGPELQELIDAIKPKKLIPIHTEHPEEFENDSGEVRSPRKAEAIEF
ncbi:MAG: MBL fold metallo-hydrolase [Candidatus Natronoplasma sp.]